MSEIVPTTILLSFDIEEFDVPREHGVDIPFDRSVAISVEGATRILDLLKRHGVRATFFCTADFADAAPGIIDRIVGENHEVASHGCSHWRFETGDLALSRRRLEALAGCRVEGYRQARMMPVADGDVRDAGYVYNSSLNPTFIPGRYMHLSTPRTYFMKDGVLQIPSSVTPWLRFPLFWLACHNLPMWLYRALVRRTANYDGYLSVYFHPWEFFELNDHPELKMPFIIRHNSGQKLVDRLDSLITELRNRGCRFESYGDFARRIIKEQGRTGDGE